MCWPAMPPFQFAQWLSQFIILFSIPGRLIEPRVDGATALNRQDEIFATVNRCIREVACQAAEGGLSAPVIQRFLLTGERTWAGAGSGQFTSAQFKEDEDYSLAVKTALRALFHRLGDLLPAQARLAPKVASDEIQRRIEPMVKGLVHSDWQEIVLRELIARTFVLNLQGAAAALETELSSGYIGGDTTGWRILWACFADYGLKPEGIKMKCDGVASSFAHVRWSAYETKDPYSDVVVHEAAHLLHYLKPRHYGLHVGRHQERFVDVEFRHYEFFAYACEAYSRVAQHGDRKSRLLFAEQMPEGAFSFPRDLMEEVAALVFRAAQARDGWRLIREATVIRRVRTPAKVLA